MIEVIKRKKNIKLIFGTMVVILVTCFTWYFSWINEPIGDDILCYYDRALTLYLDEFERDIGQRITNFSQIQQELKFAYLYWTGRMPGYAFNYVGKLLPKFVQALLTALIFSSNVFLALRIGFKSSKKVLSSPLSFGVLWLVLYWYRPEVYYTYMWTMVSIYSFSVLLVLLYYNLTVINMMSGRGGVMSII